MGWVMVSGPRKEDAEGVRWIYFDRPEALNALRRSDIVETRSLVEEARGPMTAIVFAGAGGRSFSAGIHVTEFLSLTPEQARGLIGDFRDLLESVRRAPIPTVCAIGGYCLGGAMELAMVCDIRVAAQNAVFGMPEIKVGIPSVLDAALLSQHVGLSKAKEMLLTGDMYGAAEMERYGFLNRVVKWECLEDEVGHMLGRLTGHSRVALAAQKRLFERWQNEGLESSIEASVDEFSLVFGEQETQDIIEQYADRVRNEQA